MNSDRWEIVQELFETALGIDERGRDAFVREACGDDHDLYNEVMSLLQADERDHSLLEANVLERIDILEPEPDAAQIGEQVGPYKLIERIGAGGMGLVFRAKRVDGLFEQEVALKLIKRGMDSEQILKRFEAERQILARLQHDNIARLYDGGVSADGLPYFAMEYVDGAPIDAYCNENKLSVDDRLELFVVVCKAVLYAHANLVVHRDLKPENILVTTDGTVKLLDFGIAKVLQPTAADAREVTRLTAPGMRVLTPGYAAPEQARGESVGTSADIYSLGVVLYELLVGQRPATSDGAVEPARPSTAVTRTTGIHQNADRISRRLSGDLDVICLKALRHEPERRYVSVEAFSDDVQRHLEGMPVLARPDTVAYRTRKFIARHRVAVTSTAAAIVVALMLVSYYTNRVADERDLAQAERDKAEQVAAFMQGLFDVSDTYEDGRSVSAETLLDRGAERVDEELADQPEVLAAMLKEIGGAYYGLGLTGKSAEVLKRAVAVYDGSLAPTEDLADIHIELGRALDMMNLSDEGNASYLRALEIRRALLGPDSRDVAESELFVGMMASIREDYALAESMMVAANATLRRAGLADSVEMAYNLNQLGQVYYWTRDYERADSTYQIALGLLNTHHPGGHVLAVDLLQNRANAHRRMRSDSASAIAFRSLDMMAAAYETGDPDYFEDVGETARLFLRLGNRTVGDSLFHASIAAGRALLGNEHPKVATQLVLAAQVYDNSGDVADLELAAELRREALKIQRAANESEHTIATNTNNFGLLLMRLGRYEEAFEMTQETLRLRRAIYGPDGYRIVGDLYANGRILMLLERYPESEDYMRQSLALRIREEGEDSEDVAFARVQIALVVARQGRFREAEQLIVDNLPRLERPGVRASSLRTSYQIARDVYEAWGRDDRVAEYSTRLEAL